MQLLAIQAADEARHIEVFTRRALLLRSELGLSTAGGQASLKTLLDEPDFALAFFLLSVLGEGTFPVAALVPARARARPRHAARWRSSPRRTRRATWRSASRTCAAICDMDAAAASRDSRPRSNAGTTRSGHTAGLNEEVFDALVVLAAG